MPVLVHEIVRGETFFLELKVKDTSGAAVNLSGVTKTIVTENDQIPAADFALTDGDDTGDIEIRALKVKTDVWVLGFTKARIWLDWGGASDIVDEVILSLKINVKDVL